jgi:hypothetical protein
VSTTGRATLKAHCSSACKTDGRNVDAEEIRRVRRVNVGILGSQPVQQREVL